MCKILFIATEDKLNEIPFDRNHPDFNIEKVENNYPGIEEKFSNPNVYFVGTSRGCSCDFGIKANVIDELNVSEIETGIFAGIRKLFGTQKEYIEKRISKHNNIVATRKDYFEQTEKLLKIIKTHTTEQRKTEMFYCWSGEYSEDIEETQTVDLNEIELEKVFDEFYERDKIIFIKGSR